MEQFQKINDVFFFAFFFLSAQRQAKLYSCQEWKMADRFLLPSSHRLSRPKSSEVCFELREKFDIDETSADTVYATRYKVALLERTCT